MNEIPQNYKILNSIGKGGMGEVFLAHDSLCGRNVALKQMRPEWAGSKVMQGRFLREARIAAQLSHPSIIAIYTIEPSYYTMPYIEGETLKALLRKTRNQIKNGEPLDSIGASIPALIRIFLSICGAAAYAHDRGVLHRDLKPENILVGKYGEVIILDWGLADFINHSSSMLGEKESFSLEAVEAPLTNPGKIPGTLQYMAPERAFGDPSSIATDIYSLGVILYEILTLSFPFVRSSLKEFKKNFKHELILDPKEVAPDREISPHLSSIAQKCLQEAKVRYQTVQELIYDLERYIEGLPEWMQSKRLSLKTKKDWQFQENLFLVKNVAISRDLDLEWVNVMVSKDLFPGNIKLETEVLLDDLSLGCGILFSMRTDDLRKNLEEGYCLWIGSETQGVHLYRWNIEVLHYPDLFLERGRSYKLRIEKIESTIHFYLDDKRHFSFSSHLPVTGSHIGILLKDGSLPLFHIDVSIASQNILVNCLAVPDAFLEHKLFSEALKEYRKIAHSFPGRAEGREATFRAGKTLLLEAKIARKKQEQKAIFAQANDEFEKLHGTPGAPLEYLGKSLVYKAQNEIEEEVKCLELSLRKFPKHPLKPVLIENIISRLHESADSNRKAAYHFSLMSLRHLPEHPDTKLQLAVIEKYLEPLPFFTPSENASLYAAVQLAFWLSKPLMLQELLEGEIDGVNESNAAIALHQLGYKLAFSEGKIADNSSSTCLLYAQFDALLYEGKDLTAFAKSLPEEEKLRPLKLWAYLQGRDLISAKNLIDKIGKQARENENSPYFFLYGCFLAATKGEKRALKLFSTVAEKAYPPTSLLLAHYLFGRISLKKGWIDQAFFYEKLKLLQQLSLYTHSLRKEKASKQVDRQIRKLLKAHELSQ